MSEPKVYHRPKNVPAPAVDEEARIIFLPVEQIRPNRAQPRKRFDTNTMIRLADSVRRYGVLQPLTVRQISTDGSGDGRADGRGTPYELIAGERRLRAAKLAGLAQVPCIIARADDHLSAELAIIENLLREDLDMFEQAKAFGRLIVGFSLTQEQVARKMSMSQSAVANKLRLLRLDAQEQRMILQNGLTERHARALLRLPADESRKTAIEHISESHLNVAATEQYIEGLLEQKKNTSVPSVVTGVPDTPDEEPKNANRAVVLSENGESCAKKKLILKDLRIFTNSIENAVEILKQTGLHPEIEQREEGEKLFICISVEKPVAEKH